MLLTEVKSYKDYEVFAAQLFEGLTLEQGQAFTAWCLRKEWARAKDEVREDLNSSSPEDYPQLEQLIAEVLAQAERKMALSSERSQVLKAILDELGPDEDEIYAGVELAPETIDVLTLLGHHLDWCISQDVWALRGSSERCINARDAEENSGEYPLEELFLCPSIRAELEAQAAFLHSS